MKKSFFLLSLLMLSALHAAAQPKAKSSQGIAVSEEGIPIICQCSKASATEGYEAVVGLVSGTATNGLAVDAETTGTVTIPPYVEIEGVECTIVGVGPYAFYNIPGVTQIIFEAPEKITTLGKYAFAGTTVGLQTIDLSKTAATDIPDYLFYQNPAIRSFKAPATITEVGKQAFRYCTALQSVDFSLCTKLIAKGFGAASGGQYLFADCPSLKTVVLPTTGCTLIPNSCFRNSGLEEITIPANFVNFGTYVFDNDSLLRKVTFLHEDATVSLGNYTFRNCVSLAQNGILTIPSQLSKLGTQSFNGIPFEKVYCYTTTMLTCGNNQFHSASWKAGKLYVPATEGHTLWQDYRANSTWNNFKGIYEIAERPDGALDLDSLTTPLLTWLDERMCADNGLDVGDMTTDFLAPATMQAVTRIDLSNKNTRRTYEARDEDMKLIEQYFPNLRYLNVSNYTYTHIYDSLTTVDLNLPKLDTLIVDYNNLTDINLSKMPELKYFSRLHSTGLHTTGTYNIPSEYSLDISKNTKMQHFALVPSTITSIDLSHMPDLEVLDLRRSKLTTLDLSNHQKLHKVLLVATHQVSSNTYNPNREQEPLRELILTNCPNIDSLYAGYNKIEQLDVSGQTKLRVLHLAGNELTKLSLPQADSLQGINFSYNHLRALDLKGIGKAGEWKLITTGPQNISEMAKRLPNGKIGIYCPEEVDKERVYSVTVQGTTWQDINGQDTLNHVEWYDLDGKSYLVMSDDETYWKNNWDSVQVTYTYTHEAPFTNEGSTKRFSVIVTTTLDPDITTLDLPIAPTAQEEGKFITSLYYGTEALKLPTGVEARTYKVADGQLTVSKTYPEGSLIPAGEAVLLFANDHQTYSFNYESAATTEADADNLLRGFDVATTDNEEGYLYYILSYPATAAHPEGDTSGKLGFYWQVENGDSVNSAAHKVYLKVPEALANNIKGFTFDGETTGISTVNASTSKQVNELWYTLDGQQLNAVPTQKGVYLHNGKKIVVK